MGQFITGDYYVVGPVTVLEVTPAPTGEGKDFRNGSMLNPPVTGFTAYDGGFGNTFRQELTAKYPLELKPGDSLVSTISHAGGETIGKVPGNERGVRLKDGRCADVSQGAGSSGYFSAGLLRSEERRFSIVPEKFTGNCCPAWPRPTSTPTWSWAELERAFQRPWLDHVYSWESRDVHPGGNMPAYGREISRVVGEAALQLCTDAPRKQKTELCQGMIQVGIDSWAIAKRGKRGEAGGWVSRDGVGQGRKFPIVFAAIMLQDHEMLNISKNAPETAFGEDQATEFGQVLDRRQRLLHGHVSIVRAGLTEALMRICIRAYGRAPIAPSLRRIGGLLPSVDV